ncbi:MAG: M6 family metalloprotease domain-containing protein [Candidatus Cloacimonadaceae bacterium]
MFTKLQNLMLIGFMLCIGFLQAAYLEFQPLELKQPDGTTLELFASGDEYYNWLHDADGYTVKQNDKGWYAYLDKDSEGGLVFTDLIVGKDNPASANLKPWTNISSEQMHTIRDSFQRQMRELDGGRAPNTGTLNNIVIFIRFSDQSAFTQTISTYGLMFNGTTGNTMQNYFLEASYNQLNVSTTFYPTPGSTVASWQDSHPRAYYSPYSASNPIGYANESERTTREHFLLANAVNGVSAQIPSNLVVDGDGDNWVDNVCFVIKGATDAWANLLWPHRFCLYSQYAYINGKRVYDYNFQLSDNLTTSGVGVLAHEMFHSLGAPDLYHYTSDGISPVGTWDLMCSNTNPPQHMSAYMKYKYGGWISTIPTLSASGTHTLNPLTSSTGQAFRINSSNSTSQYFVVEFRKKTGTFENSVPGSGMLIYRINPGVNGNASGPPDEVYVYRYNGTPASNGTVTAATFSSETGRTAFNNTTNPYCFLADGSLGGLSISAVGSSAGSTMSFNVSLSDVPLNLTAESNGGVVNLAWQAPLAGSPSSYKIYRNNVQVSTSTSTSYMDANVTVGNIYSYYVKAVFTNPNYDSGASNTVSVTVTNLSILIIGTEANTGKGLPFEPYYGYSYSQSIYLQSEIDAPGAVISKLAYKFNGNSVFTDAVKIYMGHTNLTSFANTSSWIPLSNLTLVYNGSITTSLTAGWIELTLDTPFAYNNTQNLVIAFDENTAGYHANADEFYCTATTGTRSILFYNNTNNPDPASPPTSGVFLSIKTYVPNVKLTMTTESYAAPVPRLSIAQNGILLSWDPVPNALYYRVYKSSSPDGNYLLAATVTQTQYLDTIRANQSFYRIVAVFQ